ncbi:hypothetical protein L208DRAFT_1523899 [Tricholoma matsutake]|nr:hypothetical protein L208DRAFT_1558716 [Tricholoma matsutake 945]KAF8236739.1 hypothetical protein L208DRAFT_1523899 [Tricholoma matsutake 945]
MDPTSSLSEGFSHLSVGNLNTLHEAIFRDANQTLTQVSCERNLWTDDDHKALNAVIMKTFSTNRMLNLEPNLASLLSNITVGDKRLMTLLSDKAEDLLKRQPSINAVLQKAWKDGSFKEVQQLAILWPVVREAPIRCHLLPNEDVELTALRSAWHDSYLGNNHQLLFANTNAIPPTEKAYSNQITIVQSSGTGKSRMVHEQVNLVFTIPFNLREKGNNQDLAFPIPDNAVHDYLVTASLSDDQHILKTNYLKFLGSLFMEVNGELEKCLGDLSKKQIRTAEDLAKWWSCHLEGIRTGLYKAVIDGATQPIQILPEIKRRHEELLAKHQSKPEGSEDSDNTYYDVKMVVEFATAESARVTLRKPIHKLDHRVGSHCIKLIIYFDKAHALTKVMPKNDDEKMLYDYLCSCLNQFLTFPMFSIFLSTNSSLAQFAAPRALAKSAHIRSRKAVTHTPITETPFNCSEDLIVKAGELNIKHISTIPFMAQFGRPLFWTLLRGAGMKASELHTQILELACANFTLVASHNINSSYNTFSHAAWMAVLDIQLSLDFEPHCEKVQIEEAGLVKSHMQFAYSIPDHRESLRSRYPSKPLLAKAAAQQLWMWRTQNLFIVVKTLTNILETGLLDHGELGELTGRQLLLDAYHHTVELDKSDPHKKIPPNFSAGCCLITFIKMLYSDECADMVLDSTPDNVEGISFREAFKDALICFTHFGKMADNSGTTSTTAWVAFIHHMAIMCQNSKCSVNCIVPVLLWNSQLCEHAMTGVLIQFKRRKRSSAITKYSINQADFKFFPKALEKCGHGSIPTSYQLYISLIMELGVQVKPPEEAKIATKYKPDKYSSSSKESVRQPRTPLPIQGDQVHGTPSKMYIP